MTMIYEEVLNQRKAELFDRVLKRLGFVPTQKDSAIIKTMIDHTDAYQDALLNSIYFEHVESNYTDVNGIRRHLVQEYNLPVFLKLSEESPKCQIGFRSYREGDADIEERRYDVTFDEEADTDYLEELVDMENDLHIYNGFVLFGGTSESTGYYVDDDYAEELEEDDFPLPFNAYTEGSELERNTETALSVVINTIFPDLIEKAIQKAREEFHSDYKSTLSDIESFLENYDEWEQRWFCEKLSALL